MAAGDLTLLVDATAEAEEQAGTVLILDADRAQLTALAPLPGAELFALLTFEPPRPAAVTAATYAVTAVTASNRESVAATARDHASVTVTATTAPAN